MTLFLDARVKVRIGQAGSARPGSALLIEGSGASAEGLAQERFVLPAAVAAHPAGCACCAPRGPVAEAFSRLFLCRARGEVPYFTDVLAVPATPAGEAAIRSALATDPIVAGRFRLEE